ncbi:MAG TPA: bifunctional precorrin-2 dehydrogenase/sirohydrochlorin ferrochelatase [Acidimicrobiales bacterium]|nr:bifunctional precorrin-2 dehydrogenase/sirohydrochlorin ferrochelatase [Acidimicrobiales bacterium]
MKDHAASRRTRPPHYPVNLDLVDVPCLVVGGGPVARRKVLSLLESGAVVTVVAPAAIPELRDDPRIRWHEREYRRGEAASYRVAVAATGANDVDTQVANDARAAGVPVNVADGPDDCTFTLPAVVRRGDVQITVSTAGRSPALAAWLRTRIEAAIDDAVLDLLDVLAGVRTELRDAGVPTELPGWRRALESGLPELVRAGRLDDARALLRAELEVDLELTPTTDLLEATR